MTPDEVARLRGLLGEATPRPWCIDPEPDSPCMEANDCLAWSVGPISGYDRDTLNLYPYDPNLALVAAAVNALPGLLDELARARADALEEAAKVAERWLGRKKASAADIAAAIRALKERRWSESW